MTPLTDRDDITLWLHYYAEREWDLLHYRAQVVAWVTDSQSRGNPVTVDRIEAHMSFDPRSYDSITDVQLNSHLARSQMAIVVVGTPNPKVCGFGCAEKRGHGRWCNPQGCF